MNGGATERSESGTKRYKDKQVHIVTEEDMNSKKYSMDDVVLPLVGSNILYPLNDTGKLFSVMLKEDGLSRKTFETMEDKELTLHGDYRKILCRPKDLHYDIKIYKHPLQPLLRTDLMILKGILLDNGKSDSSNNENKEVSIGQSTENDDNKHEFESVILTNGDNSNISNNNNVDNIPKSESITEPIDNYSPSHILPLIGMVISFTLPPSSYATIALRELMRRPTSMEYQTLLMLKGENKVLCDIDE